MANFTNVQIKSFLKERENRFRPEEANKLRLKRLEKIDFSGNIHITEDKETRTGMILVKKGDLVISGINVEKGAIAVYTGEEDVLATIHYSSYSFDKSKIDVEYFKWFLRSKTFKEIVNLSIKEGIKTELKPKKFLPLVIPLPDLKTQTEIRKNLDSVEDEINELGNLNFKNEDYIQKLHQSILQEAVSGKLVPQDPKDEPASELFKKIKAEKEKLIREKKFQRPQEKGEISDKEIEKFNIPKSWVLCKLVNLCFVTKLAGFEYTQYVNLTDVGEVPVIRAQNVRKGWIDETNLKYMDLKTSNLLGRCALTKKSLLVTFIGAGIGDVAIFDKPKRWHLAPNVAKLEPFNLYEEKISIEYLLYYLISGLGQSELFKFHKATAQPSLSMDTIRKTIIALPPLSEQHRIVEKVVQLMKLCDELEEKVKENQKNSELLMEAVLREAFEV